MIVFKTFLKVLNKCKFPLIIYTAFLIFFGGFNMQTSESSMSFKEEKPDVLIVNKDENKGVTKNLVDYIKKNSNIKKIDNNKDAIDDALFYRDVNYIIYIPKNYRRDYLNGKEPEIKIKKTGDYQSSLAEIMLKRYVNVSNTYKNSIDNEEELISNINKTLSKKVEVELTSKKDTKAIEKATFYYNFLSYSVLAGTIYIICLVLSSFHEEKIKKRTIISSTDYKKHNRILLLSNILLAISVWIFYILLSIILCGKIMFSTSGIIYIINSILFTLCSVSIAFLISNLINNKEAINGIVNVVALGSSFLCGAFVPVEFLPDSVLRIAHILPSYWYINTNEMLEKIDIIKLDTIKDIIFNMSILVLFTIIFIIISNIVTKRKLKTN